MHTNKYVQITEKINCKQPCSQNLTSLVTKTLINFCEPCYWSLVNFFSEIACFGLSAGGGNGFRWENRIPHHYR